MIMIQHMKLQHKMNNMQLKHMQKCRRCGWQWESDKKEGPAACPRCKSYRWREERGGLAVLGVDLAVEGAERTVVQVLDGSGAVVVEREVADQADVDAVLADLGIGQEVAERGELRVVPDEYSQGEAAVEESQVRRGGRRK